MTHVHAVPLLLLAAAIGSPGSSFGSDEADRQMLLPLNSLVVETDHGQGLGPNGTDLHYDHSGTEPADDDQELFLQSLQESSPLDAVAIVPAQAEARQPQAGAVAVGASER